MNQFEVEEWLPCPICCETPRSVEYSLRSDTFNINCCGVSMDLGPEANMGKWNRYAAAMELASASAWRKEVWEALSTPWDFAKGLGKRGCMHSILFAISESLNFADQCVKDAEKRVDEVFK